MHNQSFFKNRIIQLSDLRPIQSDFVNKSHFYEFMTIIKVFSRFYLN